MLSPIYYLWEVTALAAGATTTQSITFNDGGNLVSLQTAASTAGVAIAADGYRFNISRQNARGLTTGNVIASAICGNANGGSNPSLKPLGGQFMLRRNDTLNVQVTNDTAAAVDRIQLIFCVLADIHD
jgi:hypothetical protein